MSVTLNFRFKHTVHPNDYYRFQYEEILHHTVNADNVIIGTSHATHGIQPEILNKTGKKFFNFALNGANPKFYLLWYKNIFRPYYKKPKYVIIAVEWFFFDKKWLSRMYEQDSEYFPQRAFLHNYLWDDELNESMLISNRYPLLKYISTPQKLFHHDAYPFLISKYRYGYVPYQKEKRKIRDFYPQNISIDKDQQKYFEDLIKMLTDDGVKIIFINPPAYNTDVQRYQNVPVYAYYESLAQKYSIPFINYNTERRTFTINSNRHYFSDGGHLNYSGSYAFSKLLMEDLKKIMI